MKVRLRWSSRLEVGDGRRRYFPVEFGFAAFGPGVEAFAVVVGVVEVAAERALQYEPLQDRGFQVRGKRLGRGEEIDSVTATMRTKDHIDAVAAFI